MLGFGDKVFLFHLTRHIVCDTEFFSFLNGKDEARQVSSPASFILLMKMLEAYLIYLDQRPVFIFTYLDGRIISEDTDLYVIFLLFLCTVSQRKYQILPMMEEQKEKRGGRGMS